MKAVRITLALLFLFVCGCAHKKPTILVQPGAGGSLQPLFAKGHPVDWWFAFKFNSASFPKCAGGAVRQCPFGGQVQSSWTSFSQQFAVASSDSKSLQAGSGCAGDTTGDPIGATFD